MKKKNMHGFACYIPQTHEYNQSSTHHEYYVSKLFQTRHHFHNKNNNEEAQQASKHAHKHSNQKHTLLPPVSLDLYDFFPVRFERHFRDAAPPAFPCVLALSAPPAEL